HHFMASVFRGQGQFGESWMTAEGRQRSSTHARRLGDSRFRVRGAAFWRMPANVASSETKGKFNLHYCGLNVSQRSCREG
ncbi:MAG: hypothetical protein KDH17_21455, partial [Rhodocyclaceae bacterium]|nr:hypothetical protein [Rhodocyclaceae bacterium]